MYRAMDRSVSLFSLMMFLVGCGLPETRYLTCIPRPPAIEAQSYDLHDPFPDEDLGPATYTRPRGFMQPRTESRKNLDQRLLKAKYGFPTSKYTTWDQPRTVAQYPAQPFWASVPPTGQQPIAQ